MPSLRLEVGHIVLYLKWAARRPTERIRAKGGRLWLTWFPVPLGSVSKCPQKSHRHRCMCSRPKTISPQGSIKNLKGVWVGDYMKSQLSRSVGAQIKSTELTWHHLDTLINDELTERLLESEMLGLIVSRVSRCRSSSISRYPDISEAKTVWVKWNHCEFKGHHWGLKLEGSCICLWCLCFILSPAFLCFTSQWSQRWWKCNKSLRGCNPLVWGGASWSSCRIKT